MADFFRRYVLHNLGLKLLSLVLAVGLWVAVARDPIAEVAVSVPVEFQRIPDNLEVSSQSVPQAQTRVRGPERMVRAARPAAVHVEIELPTTKPGERTLDRTAQQV